MATVTEIAPDLFVISTFIKEWNLQFNQFLVRDDQPLLYHTGMKGLFPGVKEGVAKIIDPAKLRWISFSHFESDECGSLNEWLAVSPQAETACSLTGARINVTDFAGRTVRELQKNDIIDTGKYRFRFLPTPQLPHGWDAGMLFEETQRTLLCSDLFNHLGDTEAVTESDVVGRFREMVERFQAGPMPDYMPYTKNTEKHLQELAALNPQTCCTMHGSSYRGDGAKALQDLGKVVKEIYGP